MFGRTFGRVLLPLALLALVPAPSALGAIAGTGTFTIDTEGDLSFTGQAQFDDFARNVFGTTVNLGDVGAVNLTGQVTGGDLSNATFTLHGESATPGVFSFDASGSAVCRPNCLFGDVTFAGAVTSTGGSVALPAAAYAFAKAPRR